MEDLQLSRDFWLHEAPCYQLATPEDVGHLQETTARVLQPARNVFGVIDLTSWKWWSAGCVPRTGTHSWGGTVDIQPRDADTREVFEWGATNLLPSGYIGRWIYEPEILDAQGKRIQGEHIHVAPRADMVSHNGDSTIKALVETSDGSHYVYAQIDQGSFQAPYILEPLVGGARKGVNLLLVLGIPALVALLFGAGRSGEWTTRESW